MRRSLTLAISDAITEFATLANARAWNADPEQTVFLCDLTGWSVSAPGFDTLQNTIEVHWEELLKGTHPSQS